MFHNTIDNLNWKHSLANRYPQTKNVSFQNHFENLMRVCCQLAYSALFKNDQKTIAELVQHSDVPNLSPHEEKAILQLQNNKSIVIKPADKGSAMVIMDRTD